MFPRRAAIARATRHVEGAVVLVALEGARAVVVVIAVTLTIAEGEGLGRVAIVADVVERRRLYVAVWCERKRWTRCAHAFVRAGRGVSQKLQKCKTDMHNNGLTCSDLADTSSGAASAVPAPATRTKRMGNFMAR